MTPHPLHLASGQRLERSRRDVDRHGKFCLLKEVAVPKFGSKTRINEFFHITPEVAAEFGIEKEYLRPLVKSPKESARIEINPKDLSLRIFVCRRTKTELKKLHHTGALKYIEWGERQRYTRGEFEGLL